MSAPTISRATGHHTQRSSSDAALVHSARGLASRTDLMRGLKRYGGDKKLARRVLKKAAKIKSGSGEPNRNKVGKVTKAQLLEIVEMKKDDLNAFDPEQAIKTIAGTARSMGLEVEG